MRAERNKYVAKSLRAGNSKDLSSIFEILGGLVASYSLASGGERTMETGTKNVLCITCKLLGHFLLNNLRHL